jgi:hypothetical protein
MTKLIAWFTGLDTTAKVIISLVGVGLIVIGIATAFHLVDTLTETAEQKGAVIERAEAQGKALENVQTANETRAAVRDQRSRAAYDECVRSARNPANCERFLPE